LAHAVFTANINNLSTAIGFFQNPNDLALRKSRLLHLAFREAIFTRNLYFSMARFYGKAKTIHSDPWPFVKNTHQRRKQKNAKIEEL
jgi:hypothetical protein